MMEKNVRQLIEDMDWDACVEIAEKCRRETLGFISLRKAQDRRLADTAAALDPASSEYKLAIKALAMSTQHIVQLEATILPPETANEMRTRILSQMDNGAMNSGNEQAEASPK